MQTWSVRDATPSDVVTLAEFNCALARETEGRELDPAVVTRGVARGIERAPEVQYLVAEAAGDAIGVLMLTREWSDWRDGWLAWIQSVYVAPPHRGRGVFRSLLNRAISDLQGNPDVVGVRLYVESQNHRAQEVYQRSGFVDPHYKVLERILDPS